LIFVGALAKGGEHHIHDAEHPADRHDDGREIDRAAEVLVGPRSAGRLLRARLCGHTLPE
jgi:hypothetical protein